MRWVTIRKQLPFHRHSILQLCTDAFLVGAAYIAAFALRFDGALPQRYHDLLNATLLPAMVSAVAIFLLFGLYNKWWRFAGQRDYEAIIKAVIVAVAALVAYIVLVHPVQIQSSAPDGAVNPPAGVVALYFLLLLTLIAGSRLLVHSLLERPVRGFRPKRNARDILIIGAGDGGQLVLREVVRNPDLGLRPVGFIDDDPRKQGMRLANGLRVLGSTKDIGRILDETEPDEVIIAIPSAPGMLRGRVVAACRGRGVLVRTLPTVFELLQTGAGVMRQVREVRVEDVLGREPIRMELDQMGSYLKGETVLVTGAGGSIGSELCRQIARTQPRQLILVDHAEDNLFAVTRELQEDRHFQASLPVLADCKEEERIRAVLAAHRPSVVFHAAAYKHVGLMEVNAVEAIRNNALATWLVSHLAGEYGVRTFVHVSTDKAVAPATVMGASKALAEWAVEAASSTYGDTAYKTVRFGNVLGSSNSVVPIFQRQIAAGGPVTVTDPEMKRFFMTIAEAVQLIIRAGSLGGSGAVFVLEMGEPVEILELARTMVQLSGLELGRDIAIEIIGRRPGEKLYEELFNGYEQPQPTAVEKIILAERTLLDPGRVREIITEVEGQVAAGDSKGLAERVAELARERLVGGKVIKC